MEFGILFSRFRLAIFVSVSSIIESGQLAKVDSVRLSDLLAVLPVATGTHLHLNLVHN